MAKLHTNSTARNISEPISPSSLVDSYDRSARQSESFLDPARSPLLATLAVGSVLAVNPKLHVHDVQVPGVGILTCTSGLATGSSIGFKVNRGELYGPGTLVLVTRSPALGVGRGIIVGAYDNYSGFNDVTGAINLAPQTPVGTGQDRIAEVCLNSPLTNYNAGRPLDMFSGDASQLSDLGVGLWTGPTVVALRAGYDCGVECHWLDSVLRLSGLNMEVRTAGREVTAYNDLDDYTEIRRVSPWVKESLGARTRYGRVPAELGEDGSIGPAHKDQQGYWRLLGLTGFLGGLDLKYGIVPVPVADTRLPANEMQQDEVGVFRQHLDVSGAYTVTSAKSIALVKDCLIAVPRERYHPDDTRGDRTEDVETARARQDFVPDLHLSLTQAGSDSASLERAAASDIVVSHAAARSTDPFGERSKDWQVLLNEQLDLAGLGSAIEAGGYMSEDIVANEDRYYSKLPKVGLLRVTERDNVAYYASRALFVMHDDGAIHIEDGYGACISLRGGSIDISCPGDVTIRPGRTFAVIAGDSVSMSGGVDVELAAMRGDVRVHADRNVMVVGGNDGKGGVVIESKAASPMALADESGLTDPVNNANYYGGIWLKSLSSSTAILSSQIYAGNGAGSSTILLDSGASGMVVTTGARTVLSSSSTEIMTRPDSPKDGAYMALSGQSAYILAPGQVAIKASGLSYMGAGRGNSGQVSILGSMQVTESVSSRTVASVSTTLATLDDTSFEEAKTQLIKSASEFEESVQEATSSLGEVIVGYDLSVAGSGKDYPLIAFAYPDSSMRGISEDLPVLLVESGWQARYRDLGVGASLVFKGVDPAAQAGTDGSIRATMPWPGVQALDGKLALVDAVGSGYIDDKLRYIKPTDTSADVAVVSSPGAFHDRYRVMRSNTIRSKKQ